MVLLAAFLPFGFEPALNTVRLALFNAGAMAVVIAVHRRQLAVAPKLSLVASVPALLANAWFMAMTVIAIGRSEPIGAGDFGLVYFWAGAAMWLADAWFGLVALRVGLASRLGGLVLAIGSLLAITGMDRLGLTSGANPTIFGPLALIGIALNGIGWIILGLDVVTRRKAVVAARPDVQTAG